MARESALRPATATNSPMTRISTCSTARILARPPGGGIPARGGVGPAPGRPGAAELLAAAPRGADRTATGARRRRGLGVQLDREDVPLRLRRLRRLDEDGARVALRAAARAARREVVAAGRGRALGGELGS